MRVWSDVLLLASPRAPSLSIPAARFPLALAAVCCVVAVISTLALSRPLRSRVVRALARVRTGMRALHGSRARVGALWGGSLAFTLLHAAVLIAVVRALDVALPTGQVLLAYLVASGAAALLPTPGGLGSLDAALAFALSAAGASGSVAVSAVLGHRLLTAWLPLVPGLMVLGLLAQLPCSEPDRCRQRDAHRERRTLAGPGDSTAVSPPWRG